MQLLSVTDHTVYQNGEIARRYLFKKDGRKLATIMYLSEELIADMPPKMDAYLLRKAQDQARHMRYHRNATEKRARHERMLTGKHGLKRPGRV